MRLFGLLAAGLLAPITVLAAPAGDHDYQIGFFSWQHKRANLCNLKSPPSLCQPNASVTAAETALSAYEFYKAFVVDGDSRTMFSFIDSAYIQHHPGYANGPQAIWPLFCSGAKLGSEADTALCFVASTNMSYAQYSTTDRWRWVDGCVHEHWDEDEKMPPADECYKLNTTSVD